MALRNTFLASVFPTEQTEVHKIMNKSIKLGREQKGIVI
jgi:hypothetical protein